MKYRHTIRLLLSAALLLVLLMPFALSEEAAGYAQLEPEDTGDAVLALQQKLIDLGYMAGTPSGTLDEATQDAISYFQIDNGLEADGLASPELQEMVFAAESEAGQTDAALSEPEAGEAEAPASSEEDITYIGNKRTKKLHLPTCDSVKDMKESNKVEFTDREEAIEQGYQPCKRCNP